MRPYQPAVLPRLVFESGEISLSGVGGFRDHGIVEIVKHVWQGGESHTPGPFEIAEHAPAFGLACQALPVPRLPGLHRSDELIPLGHGADRHDVAKQGAPVPGVRTFGRLATPTEALPLDVDQTALNDDRRPHLAQDPEQVPVAIDGRTARREPVVGQRGAKRLQMRRALRHVGGRIHHGKAGRIHHRQDAFPTIQKGAIEDQLAGRRELARQGRWLVQPMRTDSMKRPRAVATWGGRWRTVSPSIIQRSNHPRRCW